MHTSRIINWKPRGFAFKILIVLIAVGLLLSGGVLMAQDPNFNDIDDPLNGQYELFTVDDLLIMRTKPLNNNTASQVKNYILETANETISSQSVVTADTTNCWLTTGSRQPQRTRVGRFFDLPYDVYVTLLPFGKTASGGDCMAPAGEPNMSLHIESPHDTANQASPFTLSADNTAVAMDDFNQDGFADLFIMSQAEMVVATAMDVGDRSAGMAFGAVTALPTTSYAARTDPTTGDFNADGLKDVAWIAFDNTVHFATVCPGNVAETLCAGRNPLDVILDPPNSRAAPIPAATNCDYSEPPTITAGDFTTSAGDDLLVLDCQYNYPGYGWGNYNIQARWYQLDSSFRAIGDAPKKNIVVASFDFRHHNSLAQAGKLEWLSSHDQVVFVSSGTEVCRDIAQYSFEEKAYVGVLTFGEDIMTFTSTVVYTGECSWGGLPPQFNVNGLALGHFATIPNDATSDSAFNQQIATLRNDGNLRIYKVNPPTSYQPALVSQTTLNNYPDDELDATGRDSNTLNWLTAGDLQGRSARLGAPSVIRVSSHSQPSVILGAPPMHVDYIKPDPSTSTDWQVVNFSAVPDTFNSSYEMSQSGSNQSSDTNTTSYSYATTKKTGGGFKIEVPDVGSLGGSTTKTVENKNEDVRETYAFTQNEFTYNASTTTGFGDEIWYDESSFNIYLYPVIGQTICPADNSNCSADEEQPLYVMFSGPNSGGTGPAPGASTEWYQPVHEPGNLFSYPWNETMLAAQVPLGIDLLTSPLHFFTDDSTQAQHLQWASGTGQDLTTGSTNTQSHETAYSLSGGIEFAEGLGVDLDGELDYNDSTAVSTLNKSSSSLGASQGISIVKPGTFLNSGLYQYRVEPYIFGRVPPAGQVDQLPLTEDITTTGPLQVAFAANPLAAQAGSWWESDVSPYTQYIDVALNHPVRWSRVDPTAAQDALSCRADNCMGFNDPDPDDLWNSEFYWMRGLLVTIGGANGPQRSQATAGDTVVLQARVYNYSFKDMDVGASIKVRFYRQEINGTTAVGDSVLISEKSVDPLPGFNSLNSPDTANWTTVTAELDTTGLGGTYQIFWVVVWAEDASGNMLTELQGHGLSAKPGVLTSIGDVPLERVTVDSTQKTFSNNVGYLHRKLYIAAPFTGLEAERNAPVLKVQHARVRPLFPQAGERVIVSADIASKQAPAKNVLVQIFPDARAWKASQHDPSLPPPRPFDVEMLPFIDMGGTDRLEVPYRADSDLCGRQKLLIVARSGPQGEAATAMASFFNRCRREHP